MKAAGIYIHIPFCKNKCNYCDYYSLENRQNDINIFIKMLLKEIKLTSIDANTNWTFDTIYFGGGTPSEISISDISNILSNIKKYYNISNICELNIEINPDETKKDDLELYKKLNFNRLSFGFQTLNKKLLKIISRNHTPNDCISIFENARNIGFDNINIDLLYGIPTQSTDNWIKNLKKVISLNPEHIAIYPFTIEENTPIFNKIKSGMLTEASSTLELDMYKKGTQLLIESGFIQYEIAHFSKPDKSCKHNKHYWNFDPYISFGPSAHSFDGNKRWWNTCSLDHYINNLSNNVKPIDNYELLNDNQKFNEKIILGLRTNTGINKSLLNISDLKKIKKYLYFSKNTIKLKPEFYYMADQIISKILI